MNTPKIRTTTCGIYPKLIESEGVPHLKRSLHRFDEGQISSEELEEVIQKNIRAALEEMREAGVTVFNDALVRWTDFFAPFSQSFSGISPGTLKRIFDTNTLQRKPKISGKISWAENNATKDFTYAHSLLQEGEEIKASIPGPFTFADASDNEFYENKTELLSDLSEALNRQILEYEKSGADFIEVYDPVLAFSIYPNAKETYETLLQGVSKPVILGSFYGTVRDENLKLLESLLSGFSLDLVSKENLPRLEKAEVVQVGIFDARNTLEDDIQSCQDKLNSVTKAFPNARTLLALNNSPEFLPRKNAREKISALSSLVV